MNWNLRLKDTVAGFNISLLAFPLGISIAAASHFPVLSGLLTTCIAGFVTSFFMGSYATIQGPAAGLIPVVASGVMTLGLPQAQWGICIAGLLIIGMSFINISQAIQHVPSFLSQAMLSAIGLSILLRQLYQLLSINTWAQNTAWHDIASWQTLGCAITLGSIALLFHFSWKKLPLPVLVSSMGILYAAILQSCGIHLPKNFFIAVPPMDHFFSNFAGLSPISQELWMNPAIWGFIIQLVLVQLLETLLSAQALAQQEPFQRKVNLQKDLFAIGIASTISAMMGGLPIIVEPVRSQANIQLGATSQLANFFHAIFLGCMCWVFFPYIQLIPQYSLSIILCFVAVRLFNITSVLSILKKDLWMFAFFSTALTLSLITNLLVGMLSGALLYYGHTLISKMMPKNSKLA